MLKTRRLFFFHKTIGSNNYSNWKQFQVFKIAKFEFKVTLHCGLWKKKTNKQKQNTQLWPLKQGFQLLGIAWR